MAFRLRRSDHGVGVLLIALCAAVCECTSACVCVGKCVHVYVSVGVSIYFYD